MPTCGMQRARAAFRQKLPEKLRPGCRDCAPTAMPRTTSPNSAETLLMVKTFWMIAPVFTPKILITDQKHDDEIATRFCVFRPTSMLPSVMGPIVDWRHLPEVQ